MATDNFDFLSGIQQATGAAVRDIENIFSGIARKKQMDIDLVQNTISNLEALENSTLEYGQTYVEGEANKIKEKLASAFKEKGELDYSVMASIKKDIRNLAKDKNGIDASAKLRTEYYQKGTSSVDYMMDINTYMKNVDSIVMNPENWRNMADMRARLEQAYGDNRNVFKGTGDILRKVLGTDTQTGVIKQGEDKIIYDEKGNEIDRQYGTEEIFTAVKLKGTSVDENGKLKIDSPELFYPDVISKLEGTEDWQRLKMRYPAMDENSLVDKILESQTFVDKKTIEFKTSEKREEEAIKLNSLWLTNQMLGVDWANYKDMTKLKKEALEAQIRNYNANSAIVKDQANREAAARKARSGNVQFEKYQRINLMIDGIEKNVVATNVRYDKTKGRFLIGYVDGSKDLTKPFDDPKEIKYVDAGPDLYGSVNGQALMDAFVYEMKSKGGSIDGYAVDLLGNLSSGNNVDANSMDELLSGKEEDNDVEKKLKDLVETGKYTKELSLIKSLKENYLNSPDEATQKKNKAIYDTALSKFFTAIKNEGKTK